MHSLRFLFDIERLPKAADEDQASLGIEHWCEASRRTGDASLRAFADEFATDPSGRALLECVFGNSPFLTHCLLHEMGFVRSLVKRGFDAAYESLLLGLRRRYPAGRRQEQTMRGLRIAKRRTALLVALADITGTWELERVTRALTRFADEAISIAARHLLALARERGELPIRDPVEPDRNTGLVLLGMGKLGGGELNYSSDVDLVVLYDDERFPEADRSNLQPGFVRLARGLVHMLEERTHDGYVFRTDLRLRPDPGSTPLAMSVLAAETYYESLGQNWERSALIKARPVGGDLEAGAGFLHRLVPFIWRRNLDFAAIQDIHSIKRQIDAHRGGGRIAVFGHNVKLGRGGIREIEFFTQTQQLIWGGRDPRLRSAATCESLVALASAGLIRPEVAAAMINAYRFLRRLEHRLQMVNDRQTHLLPADEAGIAALSAFLGYDGTDAFARELLGHLRRVEEIYGDLFEGSPSLSKPGNLVFTGSDDDPETLRTLERMGFREGASVSATIRTWHRGRYRATRSSRARELLTELMPALLDAFAGTANPDAAFFKFNEFLNGLPAGVQLFSLFQASPGLLGLLAEIMGSAPKLADHLCRHSTLFDVVLTPGFFDLLPEPHVLQREIEEALARSRDFEDVLDISRRWANDRKFQIGVQILRHLVDADAASGAFSDVAESAVAAILPRVEAEFAKRHGRVAGAGMAVVAMGKLGGREMTVASDLDLIFVHDVKTGMEPSDGEKPLPSGQYFARLAQRLINAITAPTREGKLYEVDMRLRPSGKSGPIASSLAAFRRYQKEAAWTWERMALTRARAIAGPPRLRQRIEALIREVLTARRDPVALVVDVDDMRERIATEYPGISPWDIKYRQGGLIDVEFIAQYLQLRHAQEHPEILCTNTTGALTRMQKAGLIDPQPALDLIEAAHLWHRLQGMIRLTAGESFREEVAPEGLRKALATAGEAASFPALRKKAEKTARLVRSHYEAIIRTPAQTHKSSTVKEKAGEGRRG